MRVGGRPDFGVRERRQGRQSGREERWMGLPVGEIGTYQRQHAGEGGQGIGVIANRRPGRAQGFDPVIAEMFGETGVPVEIGP